MSIDLKFLLHKNKTTIQDFIKANKIKAYKDMVAYCNERGIHPISEEEYGLIATPAVVAKKVVDAKPTKPAKRKTTKRTKTTRTNSKAQK